MINIDLIGENTVEIGATYKASFSCCGLPDLNEYVGNCQIRVNNTSTEVILSPSVTVIDKDKFSIGIAHTAYPSNLTPGTYQYDVLFIKNDATERFYAIGGKVLITKRITIVP